MTRGAVKDGDFKMLQSGVKKLSSLIYVVNYHIGHAITDAAKATYLATLIEIGEQEEGRQWRSVVCCFFEVSFYRE